MQFCRVSGVLLPAIAGVLLRQIHHDPVARDFGDDGCGSDGQANCVALDDCRRAALQPGGDQIAVDQHMRGRVWQPCHRAFYGQMAGAQDVQLIYFRNGGVGDAGLRPRHDQIVKPFAAGGSQGFAVGKARRDIIWVQDHGGGGDRPCKRATTHLIDASNKGMATGGGGTFIAEVGGWFGHGEISSAKHGA